MPTYPVHYRNLVILEVWSPFTRKRPLLHHRSDAKLTPWCQSRPACQLLLALRRRCTYLVSELSSWHCTTRAMYS